LRFQPCKKLVEAFLIDVSVSIRVRAEYDPKLLPRVQCDEGNLRPISILIAIEETPYGGVDVIVRHILRTRHPAAHDSYIPLDGIRMEAGGVNESVKY